MDKKIAPCNPWQGVGWGQTPTLSLQLGPRYHAVVIEAIATSDTDQTLTLADVLGLITVKVDGKPQRTFTATELDAIQTAYGANFAALSANYNGGQYVMSGGVPQGPQTGKQTIFQLVIHFAEPWRKSYAAQESFAWYTAWQDGSVLPSFTIEAAIPALGGNVAAASTITLNSWAITDTQVGPLDANKRPVALVTRWERTSLPYTGVGPIVLNTLPKRDVYEQISFFSAYKSDLAKYDRIGNVKVEVDSRLIRDTTKARNDAALIEYEWNEAGILGDTFHLAFDLSDIPTDGLVMQVGNYRVNDFVVTVTIDGNVTVSGGLFSNAEIAATSPNVIVISQVFGGLN